MDLHHQLRRGVPPYIPRSCSGHPLHWQVGQTQGRSVKFARGGSLPPNAQPLARQKIGTEVDSLKRLDFFLFQLCYFMG